MNNGREHEHEHRGVWSYFLGKEIKNQGRDFKTYKEKKGGEEKMERRRGKKEKNNEKKKKAKN